jgi:hypothetical protein
MSLLASSLLIVAGLAIMAYGIFIFYAWLPLLYGLLGLEIGLLLGRSITGAVGPLAMALGIVAAVALFFAAYSLEPYRRILLGITAGAAVGLSLAALLGLEQTMGGALGMLLAVVGAIAGASIIPRYFDQLIVAASAFAGATMAMAGAHALLPGVGLFDRAAGGPLPGLVTLILTAVGIGWQLRNITAAVRSAPLYGDISGTSVRDYGASISAPPPDHGTSKSATIREVRH